MPISNQSRLLCVTHATFVKCHLSELLPKCQMFYLYHNIDTRRLVSNHKRKRIVK